jgi:cytochrome c-type biogenesis protein
VAVLPSYLGYLATRHGVRHPVRHALLATAAMAVVFVAVFGVLGMAVRATGQALFAFAPASAILVALALMGAGVATLAGAPPAVRLRTPALAGERYLPALFAYALSFALTSVSCTLPVFLSIALQATTLGTVEAALTFLTFAAAMGFVLLPISLAGVLVADRLRHVLSGATLVKVERASGLIMVLSATYLLWYWTLGPEHLV